MPYWVFIFLIPHSAFPLPNSKGPMPYTLTPDPPAAEHLKPSLYLPRPDLFQIFHARPKGFFFMRFQRDDRRFASFGFQEIE
jgi:hypothetical protein